MTFIGTNVSFQLLRDPVWTGGGYELDTAHVPYQGILPLRDAYVNGLTRFGNLPGFTKVWLMRYSSDDEPHFPTVTLEYQGCKSGAVPPPKGEDGKTIQNISTTVIATGGQYKPVTAHPNTTVTLEIQFYAAQTVWNWYSLTNPGTNPLYATVRRPIDPLTLIVRQRFSVTSAVLITGDTTDPNEKEYSGPVATLDTGTYTQLRNSLQAIDEVTEYKVEELVPSQLWKCSSTVNRTLQPV